MQVRRHGVWWYSGGGLLAMWLWLGGGATAQAQYRSSFSYYNARTGRGYAQDAYYGRGYYSGGFSSWTPYRSFSVYSGYGAPQYRPGPGYGYYGPRHCW